MEYKVDTDCKRRLKMENEDEIVEQTTDTENVDTLTTEELEGQEVEAIETTDSSDELKVEEEETKKFTQEELNKIVKDRLSRQEDKLRNEYEQKYSRVENVLNAGLGTDNIEDATNRLTEFYKEKGIEIPEQKLTARQERMLANAEANEIIAGGYDEIVEEIDRLAQKGPENLTSQEKLIFTKLAAERTQQEALKELATIGVGKEVLESKEFKDFSNKLNPNLSIKEKYEMYENSKPKKKVEQIGSMKGTQSKETGLKDYYSFEEANSFTREQLMKNPKLLDVIQKSASKWK